MKNNMKKNPKTPQKTTMKNNMEKFDISFHFKAFRWEVSTSSGTFTGSLATNFPTKGFRSKRLISPYTFQLVSIYPNVYLDHKSECA